MLSLGFLCWHRFSDSVFQSHLKHNILQTGDCDCPVHDHEPGLCHLMEGAESRIGLEKIRTDRILICLSSLCRHTDVKGKRRGMWWGGTGYQAFTSDRKREKKKEKKRFINWLLCLNFCSTYVLYSKRLILLGNK